MAKYSKAASKSVGKAISNMEKGQLTIGNSGKKVTSKKQAIAIGLSEAKEKGAKVPPAKKAAATKKATPAKTRTSTAGSNKNIAPAKKAMTKTTAAKKTSGTKNITNKKTAASVKKQAPAKAPAKKTAPPKKAAPPKKVPGKKAAPPKKAPAKKGFGWEEEEMMAPAKKAAPPKKAPGKKAAPPKKAPAKKMADVPQTPSMPFDDNVNPAPVMEPSELAPVADVDNGFENVINSDQNITDNNPVMPDEGAGNEVPAEM